MGLAILYMPFFFIAHLLAPVLGYAADGFTVPYKFALIFSCLFYLAIGLRYLRLFLQRYFSQAVVALTILSVTIGTNLLYYATQDAFWATFLKRRGGNKYWEAIRLPDYDKARKGIYVTVEPEKNQ
jgi:hypothetical protein